MPIPSNLIYSGTFQGYKVYIEEEPDIDKPNPSIELKKLLYSEFEKQAIYELNKKEFKYSPDAQQEIDAYVKKKNKIEALKTVDYSCAGNDLCIIKKLNETISFINNL